MLTANYDAYMAQPYLKNCGVVIRSNVDDSILLNNNTISSLRLARQNCGVPEQVPYDDLYVEIRDWQSLSNTVKEYLGDKTKFIKLGFIVENVETSDYIVLAIDNCKVNFKGDKAELKCYSPFRVQGKFIDLSLNLNTPLLYGIGYSEGIQHYAIAQAKGMKIPNYPLGSYYDGYDSDYIDFNDYQTNVTQQPSKVIDIDLEKEENDRSAIVSCGIEVLE